MTIHKNKSYSEQQLQLQEQLIDAARNSDIVAMKKLIKSGADPLKKYPNDKSAMFILIQNNLSELKKITFELAELSIRGQA